MTEQTTAGAAPAAPAPVAQPGQPDPAAVAEAWKAARAKQPGLRFTKLPPNVAALYAQATPATSAPAPAGDIADATQAPSTPADAATAQDANAPAEAATAHDVSAFAGDNAPMGEIDAMQAREGLSHRLQVADEIPGFDAGIAKEYGKQLAEGLRNPPTHAQKLQAMAETARTLQWRYPDGKDKQVLADAQSELKLLAARIPELPGWLERTGGGNDVGVIIRLAERHAQRAAARIASAARGAARG